MGDKKNENKKAASEFFISEKKKDLYDTSFTQNRELSWLEFNRRVLQEGCDSRVPLMERYKFLSIFTSNLDEFFMVRVGSLMNLNEVKRKARDNKTGWNAKKQLEEIFAKMPELYQERDDAFRELSLLLDQKGIRRRSIESLTEQEAQFLDDYYQRQILPIVSPVIIDARHPFPHLLNNRLYLFCDVVDAKEYAYFGLISIPSMIPPVIFFPGGTSHVLIEDVLRDKASELFRGFRITSSAIISITRNADIDLDDGIDELETNLRQVMKKALQKRNRLSPVRLEIQGDVSKESLKFLLNHHNLSENQVFYSQAPLRMKYVFSIENELSPAQRDKLCYRHFEPQPSAYIDPDRSILDQVFEGDKLFHYPYESMSPFLQMLKEAATNPSVVSISITIYRMASISKVAEYLAQAAENGKNVLVLMELRARFDEENNIDYSERLEQAGCTIVYGLEDYKVHSKICVIGCFRNNAIRSVTQIGTGNYNEKTAKQYTDLCLITADDDIAYDARNFFKNMLINKVSGDYKKLLVAPSSLKSSLMTLFDREILRAKNGEPAEITMKCNAITEREIIDKIAEASCAGVKINMIVRGICCILPGIPGRTENVRVISIVGRYLEHHRIYAFGADREDIYISSADLMTRNLIHRVEIAAPIQDPELRMQISHILDTYFADNEKAKELQSDGSYRRVSDNSGIEAQTRFMEEAEDRVSKARLAREKAHKEAKKRISASVATEEIFTQKPLSSAGKDEAPSNIQDGAIPSGLEPQEKIGFWERIRKWLHL